MIAREIRAEFQLARALRFCTRLAQVTVGLQQISFASALSSGSEVIPYWAASLRFTLLGCTCFFTRVVYWYSTNSFALLRCFFEFGSNWFHMLLQVGASTASTVFGFRPRFGSSSASKLHHTVRMLRRCHLAMSVHGAWISPGVAWIRLCAVKLVRFIGAILEIFCICCIFGHETRVKRTKSIRCLAPSLFHSSSSGLDRRDLCRQESFAKAFRLTRSTRSTRSALVRQVFSQLPSDPKLLTQILKSLGERRAREDVIFFVEAGGKDRERF